MKYAKIKSKKGFEAKVAFFRKGTVHKMKKLISAGLSLLIILSVFSGCQKNRGESGNGSQSGVVSGESSLAPVEITPVEPSSAPEESSEPEPESDPAIAPYNPENEIAKKDELSAEFEYLAGLKTEQVPWGPGKNFDDDGKPTACRLLQAEYGKYSADFVRTGDEFDKKVYLTFDEGYENGYTSAILDTLKEKGVSAVFFVTLPYAKSEPELVKRMIDEGHIVGNHTSKHPNMTTISPEEGYDNVADLHNYVKENFDYEMYLFRFPEGAFSEQNLALLQKLGYRSVFWSFAYKDWDPNNQYEESVAFDKVTASLHSGEIFLLHAVSKTNAAILGDVIDYVRNEGYSFERYEQ